MIALDKGSQAKFVELEQNDVVKRFLVPDVSGLEDKVRGLISNHGNVSLVRIGRAVVTSKDETNELKDGLEGFPSAVSSCYTIDLCGDHPILPQGPARFSLELIEAINDVEPIKAPSEVGEQGQMSVYDLTAEQADEPKVVAPKPDLAASLRAQLETKKEETLQDKLNAKLQEKKEEEPAPIKNEVQVVETGHTTVITLPKNVQIQEEKKELSETQLQLNKAMEEAKKKREERATSARSQIKVMEPRPQGKIDILLEKVERIETALTGIPTGEVTGDELQSWFWEHHDSIGPEKTFAILASRLTR
jgi:hypothetical protein